MPIPKKIREELGKLPRMAQCIYDEGCDGRIEWEHAFIYRNRQIQAVWSIVGVCTYHHRGAGLDKNFNQYMALKNATDEELEKYERATFIRLKKFLISVYEPT